MIALQEIALHINSGSVGLWIGPEAGDAPGPAAVGVSWTAIWSEVSDPAFSGTLSRAWKEDADLGRRMVIEVPGRREETLGSLFSFSEICPFFYLVGRLGSPDLPSRERRRARDEAIDVLTQLKTSIILITGYRSGTLLATLLAEELLHDAYSTRYVICGLASDETEALVKGLRSCEGALDRVSAFPGPLAELLERARQDTQAQRSGPTVRVGMRRVPIAALLERAVPVDREFVILTEEDLQPFGHDEDVDAIKVNFMVGRGLPLHAIANEVAWMRSRSPAETASELCRRIAGAHGARVAVLDLPAEEGAGLTTNLFQIAVSCARAGCPTVVLRPETRRVDYGVLEAWMEHLAPNGASDAEGARATFVIVVDDYDGTFEATSGVSDLGARMLRAGRSVLLVRGVRGESSPSRPRSVEPGMYRALPVLRANLTLDEQESLQRWAELWWAGGAERLRRALVGWAKAWRDGDRSVPLLVALYSILRGEVGTPADVGRSILAHAESLLRAAQTTSGAANATSATAGPGQALSKEELRVAIHRIRTALSLSNPAQTATPPSVDMEALRRILLILCMFSSLRLGVEAEVLSDLCDVPESTTRAALRLLSDGNLVDLRVPTPASAGIRGRQALYSMGTRAGISHPVYARIIVEGAITGPNDSNNLLQKDTLVNELRAEMQATSSLLGEPPFSEFPVWILAPALRKLRPSASHVEFAREVAVRYLRLQRFSGSPYHEWLWPSTGRGSRRRESILSVFRRIPEAVVRQSSVLLHSRAMTTYKLCERGKAADECRMLYQSASRDLTLALELTPEEHGAGELSANLVTSLGRLFMGWADSEVTWAHEGRGSLQEATRLRDLARRSYREGIALRTDNPYAAFGLAALLVGDCEELERDGSAATNDRFGNDLAEALELLEGEPERSYVEEWEDSKQRAIALLVGPAATRAINRLRESGNELWAALTVLRMLEGEVPENIVEGERAALLRSAFSILEQVGAAVRTPSPVAAFLRYSIFSVLPDRRTNPDYQRRLELLSALQSTKYLTRPALIFEHAMLLAQVGDYRAAANVFADLRRGKRFVEVPVDRTAMLSTPGNPSQPTLVLIRIVGHRDEGIGWARVIEPRGFPDPVPFSLVEFRRAGGSVQVNTARGAWVKIAPAGFFIVPQGNRREGRG